MPSLGGASSYRLEVIETGHGGAIHDAQLDYYGKLLATGSSDNTVHHRISLFL